MRLPDLEGWAIFASVVEHRSFSSAAAAIGVSKATVSKAVSRLETDLGQSLFHRTSRRLTLTENGKALAERATRILAEARAAEEAAHDAATAPAGLIRLAAPMTLGLLYLTDLVADFVTEYPGINIDLHLSDARVDIVAEGFDVAVRIADLPDSSLRARRLGPVISRIVAAPAYLEQHGTPAHPAELGEHSCLAYTNIDGPWRFVGPNGATATVRPAGPVRANSGDALLPALRRGLGIAVLPDFIIGNDVAGGKLVTILKDWHTPAVAMHLITPPSPLRPARVEALLDYLDQHLRLICIANGADESTRLAESGRLISN